jgi:hypothetical protein
MAVVAIRRVKCRCIVGGQPGFLENILSAGGTVEEDLAIQCVPSEWPVPRSVWGLLPRRLMQSLQAFPVAVDPGDRRPTLVVAMAHPDDLSARDDIAFATGMRVKVLAVSEGEVTRAISVHVDGVGVREFDAIEVPMALGDEETLSRLLVGGVTDAA